jgi:tRNA-specific 2-thiouridylase
VAAELDIPHYVVDMEEAFTAAVIDDFVAEYASGRTPNPCVRCNSNTKIPDLLRRGRLLGCELIATGHYARAVTGPDGSVCVHRGRDAAKDQTYFLWGVPAPVIDRLRFPVGELTKPEVRELARRLGLATADKPESQEICFVPGNDYTAFLAERLGEEHPSLQAGAMVTASGEMVGTHAGYARYTVGQRKGLGGGRGGALYVLGVRAAENEVVVGERGELFGRAVTLDQLNWISNAPVHGERLLLQLRHRARPGLAEVVGVSGDVMAFRLEAPQRAITPGQSGAVYRGDQLIGGGLIR